jgi:hypothetical protein
VPSAAPSQSEIAPGVVGRAVRGGLLAAAVGALLFGGVPLCPLAYLAGIPCPGCGLTRAGIRLFHADLGGAFALSPLSPIVVPFAIACAVQAAATYLRGEPRLPPRWITRGAMVLWGALLLVWGLRFLGMFGGPVAVTSAWAR